MAGFGESYPLFIPVAESPEFLRIHPKAVFRFLADPERAPDLWIRPVYFRKDRTERTLRIVVQGGSTAAGYPYGYGASPAGMLQRRLQRAFPDRDVEVVTTAMSAVNSYTLLDFGAEIVEQRPGAVVIYAGHNEYVGLLGVGSGFSAGRSRALVLSFLRLRDSRIFQLAQRVVRVVRPRSEPRDGSRTLMATIVAERKIARGSALYRRGLEQYRANLEALLSRYRRAGIPVFLGTVVSNLRDQPPFESLQAEGVDSESWQRHTQRGLEALESGDPAAALAAFDQAVALAGGHAAGHFHRGRALDALGRHAEARRAYTEAKDLDGLRFRAPEEINGILREVAARQGARVVEVEAAFVRAARDGIVGGDLMLEHLHPNLEGYFLLAEAFVEALREDGLFGSWDRAAGSEQARAEIPVTAVDRLYGEYRIRRLTSDWPFTERPQPFRLPPVTSRVEEIAQSYYRGRYRWPDAMRALLHHYRREGRLALAADVAVLVAEAFPDRPDDQRAAAELLTAAGRPEAGIFRRRLAAAGGRKIPGDSKF